MVIRPDNSLRIFNVAPNHFANSFDSDHLREARFHLTHRPRWLCLGHPTEF